MKSHNRHQLWIAAALAGVSMSMNGLAQAAPQAPAPQTVTTQTQDKTQIAPAKRTIPRKPTSTTNVIGPDKPQVAPPIGKVIGPDKATAEPQAR